MKILMVNKFCFIKGGSETYLFSLAAELGKRNHSVSFFSMRHPKNFCNGKNQEFFVDQIDYDTPNIIEKIRYGLKILYSFEAKKKIAVMLDKIQPDIVHLHLFQHQISAAIIPEIKKRQIPIIYTAHDLKCLCPNYKMFTKGMVCERCTRKAYYNCVLNKCVKQSYLKSAVNCVEMYFHNIMQYYSIIDYVIAPSQFYRNKLINCLYPKEKVIHLPNFYDSKYYYPKTSKNEDYILYFGRLSHEKGLYTLIDAIKKVKKTNLYIVGRGPLESKIEKRLKDNQLENVKLLGFKSGDSLRRLIQESKFTVLPSIWYENGPMAVLESFACRKPVVASDIGGIPELVEHMKTGLLFAPGSSVDLAEKLNLLITNPKLIDIMGENAQKVVKTSFNKKEHVDEIEAIYQLTH